MILRKTVIDGREVYEPISQKEALELDDKSGLIFTDEDEEDEFEEILEDMEDDGYDYSINLGKAHIGLDILKPLFSKGKGKLIGMLPFMDEEELHQVVETVLESDADYKDLPLAAMMPFLEEKDCDALFMKAVSERYRKGLSLTAMAPFISDECLSVLVDDYVNGKYPDLSLDGLYPFMDSKDVRKLFEYHIRKRKEDMNASAEEKVTIE
ncbi:MAG: hypothetical protein IJJ00_03565 [Erysipelotrichaceae bacterium]|nr:hypothetical protein [Erysipelotrichaceae bacterium]